MADNQRDEVESEGNQSEPAPRAEAEADGESDGETRYETQPYVVGIGASAGGLEALEEFFAHMPSNTGFAFVVVQHLSPDFKSLMDELLARRTSMAVHRVEHGVRIEPDAIYVIPPKQELRLADGRLLLKERPGGSSLALPIDIFLESLAEAANERAVAVILSGSGSDGSRGVRAVHDRGGTVLVQRPETAKFDSMPRRALETGVVDVTGSPSELPQLILSATRGGTLRAAESSASDSETTGLEGVLELLRTEHGLDFTHYKPNTIRRRIDRRRLLNRSIDVDKYLQYMRENPQELQALYWDLLIGVTRFFRDPEAFQYLQDEIVPALIEQADPEHGLRVWVAGCATGEEAYSLAILFREALSARRKSINVKIFATDVHRSSLEKAAAGRYSSESLAGLTEERVKRHFKQVGQEYEVVADLRHMVVFAPHDVLRDAPFTKLDLVTCRNMLIYLKPAAQKCALSLMHFGLKPRGLLFLGPSETPGSMGSEFDTLHRYWKVFRKRRDVPLTTDLRVNQPRPLRGGEHTRRSGGQDTRSQRAQQALLAKHAPPSILVGPELQVLYTFCGGGQYLAHVDGKPSLNVLDMVDAELKLTLNAALQRAQKTRAEVSYGSIRTNTERKLSLKITPLEDADGCCFLVTIEEQHESQPTAAGPRADMSEISKDRIEDLEHELRFTKENLQATLEEMETANEELQATNEELVASNEELQSTNEELHSVNEELFTVNAEHQRKIDLLTELTEDMENLFAATDVGTVFLDKELRIRRFTPKVAELFQLLPQDTGRSIAGFSHKLLIPELIEDIRQVLESERESQRHAPDSEGNWYLVRVTPYRVEDSVDGVVLSFVDITEMKQTEARLELMSKVFKDVADPIVIENVVGEILDVNPEAERVYGYTKDELLGKPGSLLVPPENHEYEKQLRVQCQEYEYVRNAETLRCDRWGKTHPALTTLSRVEMRRGEPPAIAVITKDITLRKRAEQASQEAVRRRDEFLAMLSHELRNPLSVIQNAAIVLTSSKVQDAAATERHRSVVLRQVKHMSTLLGDLLDVSRVTQGKVELHKKRLDLRDTLEEALEVVSRAIEKRRQRLEVSSTTEPVPVFGDEARLRQIQENLLTNASKYTPEGGRIRVELHHCDDEALIRISDTGRGIDSENLESIFDLFTQGPSALDRSDGGMGVGLTLVRILVGMHGGTVRALSDGRDRGSTMEVRIPLAEAVSEADSAADSAAEEGSEQPSVSSRILQERTLPLDIVLVEDNDDAREMLQLLLEVEGHRVRSAADGLAGLSVISRRAPDVALIDIGLPGIDGYELACRVRERYGPDVPRLIALTGYGRAEDKRAVSEAGFNEMLVKPTSQEQLRAALAPRRN